MTGNMEEEEEETYKREIKMSETPVHTYVKITVSISLFDFGNYSYSETITYPKFEQEPSSEFGFPETTCIPHELIVVREQNYWN